jgi:hypothetical protein
MKPLIHLFITAFCLISIFSNTLQAQENGLNYANAQEPKAIAHKNIFTFAPIGLLNKFRFRYEHVQSKTFTLGAQVTIYHGQLISYFPGVQALAVGRWYLSSTDAPFGFYVMAQGGPAYHKINIRNDSPTYNPATGYSTYDYNAIPKDVLGVVIGSAIGYQIALDRQKQIVADFYFGIKGAYVNYNFNNNNSNSNNLITRPSSNFGGTDAIEPQFWFISGPGSYLNCGINFGFSF